MKHLVLFENFNDIPNEILNLSFVSRFSKEYPKVLSFDPEIAPCDVVSRDLIQWLNDNYPKLDAKLLVAAPAKYDGGLMYHAVVLLNNETVIDLSHYQVDEDTKIKVYSKEEFLKLFPDVIGEDDEFYKTIIGPWNRE